MTRDELQATAARRLYQDKRLICQWATGTGKSAVALNFLREHPCSALILVPEKDNIKNWNAEFDKFGVSMLGVEIACYASIHKYEGTSWGLLVIDECFRGDVEVLTADGFKRFNSLLKNEKIAQYNDDGTIEFVTPIRYIERFHQGELCKLSLATGKNEKCCYMTPNHQQVYRTKGMSNYVTKSIKDISLNSCNYIPLCGKGKHNDSGSLSVLEQLAIAIQADGSFDREQSDSYVYRIQLTRERKKKRLMSILANYPSDKWRMQKTNRPNSIRVRIKMPKKDAKLLSSYFSPVISEAKAKSFIDELIQWDGSQMTPNVKYYSSKIKDNADLVSAIAVQAGYKTMCSVEKDKRKEHYSDIHRVYVCSKKEITTQSLKREYVPYQGMVYCVEVPSHKIVVRSEGYVFISGNCPHANTDLKIQSFSTIRAEHVLALGAYLRDEEKDTLKRIYGDFTIWTINMKASINAGFIPCPSVRVIHMGLDNTDRRYQSKHGYVTAMELYANINQQVSDAVAMYNSNATDWAKINMQRLGAERKRVLGRLKEDSVARVCEALRQKGRRFLCFCSTIDSAKKLGGELAYTSETPKSQKILERFNNHEIDQLYVVGKLIEGQNLNDIECGILGSIGASNRITIQSIGRIMRSDNPVIYVPVIDNTKDESFLYTVTNNVPKEYIKHYKL